MFTKCFIFDKENEAEEFGRKSMKRGFEYKVVEYNNENMIGIGINEKKKEKKV